MKIRIDQNGDGIHVELERDPLPPERFTALCKLALAAIAGAVLLGAIALVGFWVIPWAAVALLLTGIYKLALWCFK